LLPTLKDDGLGYSNQHGPTHKTLDPLQNDLDIAIQAVDAQRGSLLEELGRARDAVETIMTIVETVAEVWFTLLYEIFLLNDVSFSEVHPFAKLASLAVTAAFNVSRWFMNADRRSVVDLALPTQHLQKEEENDNNFIDLAHDMNRTLSFVAIVEDRAKIEQAALHQC
jgi:hypothetical protein